MKQPRIQDYLHLYASSPLTFINRVSKRKKVGFYQGKHILFWKELKGGMDSEGYTVSIETVLRDYQLALRPLSDMTEEEARETDTWIQWTERNVMGQVSGYNAEQIRKLLKAGFDLFDLIPNGLAIDKTKLNQPS